jgi:methyl-accepting chemotaxis protein
MSWKELTIGKKIGAGFGVILTLLVISGILSFTGVTAIVHNAGEVIEGNKLDGILAQREVDHLNWANKVNVLLTDDKATKLEVEVDDHKCGFGKWLYGEGRQQAEKLVASLAPQLKEIEEPHRRLHESAIEIGKRFHKADLSLGNFLREKKVDHLLWTHKVKDAFINKSGAVNVEADPTKCSLGKWLHSSELAELKKQNPEFAAAWKNIEEPHGKLHQSVATINKLLAAGKVEEACAFFMENTSQFANQTLEMIDKLLVWQDAQVKGRQEANKIFASQTVPSLVAVQGLLNKIRQEAKQNILSDAGMLQAAQRTKVNVTTIVVVAVLVGLLLSYLIIKGITKVLRMISDGIQESSIQVASAAKQIAAAGQSLAESASEQASTVEETTASLEEMSAMSRQTSELTRGVEALMNENIEKSGQTLKALVELTQNMSRIEADSDQIGKIIKTIDEIAFQTNLLALNAAVEAARAGEAGAGFAVVADEVRNLALRATEAAKNTQELLDTTIKRILLSTSSLKDMDSNFEGIVESATVIGEKTSAITDASQEQAKGIEQISKAAQEIDKVTQLIATNSEESSAASEQLSAQSEEMKMIVTDLIALVYGKNHLKSTELQ